MENKSLEDIYKIKNEIKLLSDEIENKKVNIINKIENNIENIIIFKTYLENIIDEYHLICKKIFN